MNYVFKYRRRLLWKSETVNGHRYEQSQDKMVIYFPDGAVRELSSWSKCEVSLGSDWVLAMKKNMEKQAGQAIPLAVDA